MDLIRSIGVVDLPKPDSPKLYVPIPNSSHLLHSKPNHFSQNATDKWSQNGPTKDDTSLKPALDTITKDAIPLFSRLQCSSHSQKRQLQSALNPIAKFRLPSPSWREVQKWTENHAFFLRITYRYCWIYWLLSEHQNCWHHNNSRSSLYCSIPVLARAVSVDALKWWNTCPVILSYAETTLNKAFQIMQKTVIVETDLRRS